MNPWGLIGDLIGWLVLAILVMLTVTLIVAMIIALVKPKRKRGATQIYSSDPPEWPNQKQF